MRRIIGLISVIILMTISGCETETEIKCFPQRITTKGDGGATSITADYKYEGDTLVRIIWSNYETHFYSYNEGRQISNVARINVQKFQKLESKLIYENGLTAVREEYLMNLNRATQEDIDTTLVGYSEFEYDGVEVASQKVYTIDNVSGEMGLESYKEYTYDLVGNMSSYVCFDEVGGDTTEAFQYTYDTQNHPFSSLELLFDGESYVNNKIEDYDLLNDEVSKYTMGYTTTNFPEQIIIKLGSVNLEITSISYLCQ